MRDAPAAIAAYSRAVSLNPALATSWEALQRLYRITGQRERAEEA
jgi:predicted TPR repeat methyltransferase